MSGETYTYISLRNDRVEALQRQAQRADALESQRRLLEQQQKAREEQARKLERKLADNESRYERHVRALGQDMQMLERTAQARFEAQRRTFRTEIERIENQQRQYTEAQFKTLDDRLQKLDVRLSRDIIQVDKRVAALAERVREDLSQQRGEYLGLLQEQARHFDEALRQQGSALQADIEALADSLSQRLRSERELAESWLENLTRELVFIRERYRHEQFAPNELNTLEQRVQLVQNNLAQGIYQTAIGSGQEAFLQARQLRERLEWLEMQWEHLRQQAYESATAVLLIMDEHSLIRYQLDADQSLELEVNYWTEGRWQGLRERIERLQTQTADPQAPMSQDELKVLQGAADAARDEALALVAMARNAAFSSIQRRDIQALILERLEQLGFQHADSSYEAEDARCAFHLKLRNGNGEEMVTIVAPTGDDFENRVTFDFFDQSPNEQVREERLNLIRDQIQAEGEMTVAPMICEPAYAAGNGPQERLDFARVRAGGVQAPKMKR